MSSEMFGYRGLVVFLIAGYLLLAFDGYSAQGEDTDSNYDDTGDYTPTYRTGIEKVLQGLLKILPSSSSSRSSESNGIITHLPKPFKTIVSDAENVTKRGFGDILNLFEKDFHAIFPGTLWCGAGNISSNEEDVGIFMYTDACCRGHDKCPSNIDAGDTKGDLINNGIFTRSACSCDKKFYHCLKNASSIIADELGDTYFNILRPQCFEKNYPIKDCAEYGKGRIVAKKCVKYDFDTSQKKRLIWVDNPDF